MADASDDLGIPMKPARPAPLPAAAPIRPPAIAPRVPDPARSGDAPRPGEARPGEVRPGEGFRRSIDLTNQPRADGEMRRLSVGREITLSGEINACDKLVIEGSVEANLNNCRDVEIAETGLFKGSASIEDAEVRGRFEGNLTVRKRLLIRATGRVSGTIRYGQIEIECGGQISGDIQAQPAAEPGEVTADAMPARAVG